MTAVKRHRPWHAVRHISGMCFFVLFFLFCVFLPRGCSNLYFTAFIQICVIGRRERMTCSVLTWPVGGNACILSGWVSAKELLLQWQQQTERIYWSRGGRRYLWSNTTDNRGMTFNYVLQVRDVLQILIILHDDVSGIHEVSFVDCFFFLGLHVWDLIASLVVLGFFLINL